MQFLRCHLEGGAIDLRERAGHRLRRYLLVGLGIGIAVAITRLYLHLSERRGVSVCKEAYAAAGTAADSALVDVQASGAFKGRLDAAYNVSCGDLRLRGLLTGGAAEAP